MAKQEKQNKLFGTTTVPASGEALAIIPTIKFASKVIDFYYSLLHSTSEAEEEDSSYVELSLDKANEIFNFFTELKEELTKED